ncbi:MAG: hypothetical protein ACRD2E_12045 [Terriglobales bacterium]
MSAGPRAPVGPLTADRLGSERRGFIAGSIIVLAVVWLTTLILLGPALKQSAAKLPLNGHPSWAQMEAVAQHEPWTAKLVVFAGALGLLVLNARFSRLIGRPRAAYRNPPDGTSLAARLGWLAVLVVNSLLYNAIVPEIIVLVLLAHWANTEIRHLRAHPPEPGGRGRLEPWARDHGTDDR